MTILAAVDETERSKQVVEIAYDLATTYDDEFVALHVIPEEEYESHATAVKEIPGFGDYSLSQQEESARNFTHRFVMETLDEDIDLDQFRPLGRVGDIPEQILSVTEQVDPRFLVIGGRRRTPAGKAIFGDRAQQILLKADCPVVSQFVDV